MATSKQTRRSFLAGTATAAGLLVSGVESARGFAANDPINVACLGTGGRCRWLMGETEQV